MSIYTYVVDHGEESPPIRANMNINGGKLTAVQFDDALEKLQEMEDFIDKLRDSTKCDQTRYSIDDFMS